MNKTAIQKVIQWRNSTTSFRMDHTILSVVYYFLITAHTTTHFFHTVIANFLCNIVTKLVAQHWLQYLNKIFMEKLTMLQQYCRDVYHLEMQKCWENTENLAFLRQMCLTFLKQNIPTTRMFWEFSAGLKLLAEIRSIVCYEGHGFSFITQMAVGLNLRKPSNSQKTLYEQCNHYNKAHTH